MASIPLQIQTPQPSTSPLTSIGQILQFKDMLSQIAMRQAQTQQAQANAADIAQQQQQRQRNVIGTQKLNQLLQDPANQKSAAQGDYSFGWNGGVPIDVMTPYITNNEAIREHAMTLDKDQAQNLVQQHGILGNWFAGLEHDATDPDTGELDSTKLSKLYSDNVGNIQSEVPMLASRLPMHLDFGSDPQSVLDNIQAANNVRTEALNVALAQKKTQQETATSAAQQTAAESETALREAQTPGATATSTREQLQTQLMQNAVTAPQSGQHPVDAIPGLSDSVRAGYRALYDTARQNDLTSGDLKQTQANQVLRQAQEFAQENSAQAVGTGAQKAAANAQASERARAALAPGAVGAIQDPMLQRKAIDDQQKAADEYSGKIGDAQRLQQFVDAARSGNQAAAAMIPLSEVREIVSQRINTQELSAAGGGVAALRRVQNWASSNVQGKPSAATLNDIEAVGKSLLSASGSTYSAKVGNINSVTGAKFDVAPPQAPQTVSSGPPKINSQAQYDALPKGTRYVDSQGNPGVKQ